MLPPRYRMECVGGGRIDRTRAQASALLLFLPPSLSLSLSLSLNSQYHIHLPRVNRIDFGMHAPGCKVHKWCGKSIPLVIACKIQQLCLEMQILLSIVKNDTQTISDYEESCMRRGRVSNTKGCIARTCAAAVSSAVGSLLCGSTFSEASAPLSFAAVVSVMLQPSCC